ncbi:MAG: histidine triad nucleotide-binding protein [Syntrophomonadaceae bacterium]
MSQDCIFCKIINKEIPSTIVFENDRILAIKDINPAAPVHILLIPKNHIDSLDSVSDQDIDLLGNIQVAAAQLAKELDISNQGYRLVNNCGEWGGQTVSHIHYHLIGGRKLAWPPG